jgi:hypothetical protein
MGRFRSIARALVLPVLHATQQFLFGCPITHQLIGDHHPWDVLTALQQLPKELLRGYFVPPALEEDIEHIPMPHNCAPHQQSAAEN